MNNPVQIGAVRGQISADSLSESTAGEVAAKFPDHAEAMRAALGDAIIRASRNILLLDAGDERVLIDTGEGTFAPTPGTLLPHLRASGSAPEAITTIILTHFHFDHIGGLLDADGKPAFPNARVIAARAEYDHWLSEKTLAALPPVRANYLRAAFAAGRDAAYPRLELVEGEAQVLPGITLLPAYGHTPGHSAVLIERDGGRLLHVADSWHYAAQLNLPEARIKFDALPEQAVAARRALMQRAESEGLLTLVYHAEFPGLGHIRRDPAQPDRRVWARSE